LAWIGERPGQEPKRSAIAEMVVRRLLTLSPANAARFHPDLFTSPEAAKKLLQRSKAELEAAKGDLPVTIRYQAAGERQKPALAYTTPDNLIGMIARLERALAAPGERPEPLAVYEVVTHPDDGPALKPGLTLLGGAYTGIPFTINDVEELIDAMPMPAWMIPDLGASTPTFLGRR